MIQTYRRGQAHLASRVADERTGAREPVLDGMFRETFVPRVRGGLNRRR